MTGREIHGVITRCCTTDGNRQSVSWYQPGPKTRRTRLHPTERSRRWPLPRQGETIRYDALYSEVRQARCLLPRPFTPYASPFPVPCALRNTCSIALYSTHGPTFVSHTTAQGFVSISCTILYHTSRYLSFIDPACLVVKTEGIGISHRHDTLEVFPSIDYTFRELAKDGIKDKWGAVLNWASSRGPGVLRDSKASTAMNILVIYLTTNGLTCFHHTLL
ncbi:hypothetical protein CGRA01v4_09772 [Colletotrichum graminicola]|nr:hypothetical protein CGRA01v4_09772 [Colletotrichum graminicola]